jgi:hypothetical protein
MRAPIPRYHDGWDNGVAWVRSELGKRDRPGRWARAALAKLRAATPSGLRDDFGWGFKDGAATTLANHLYTIDNLEGTE